jgi:hypothetical protein
MHDGGERRDVEEVPLALDDLAEHGAIGAQDPQQVHLDHALEVLERRGPHRAAHLDAGVRNRDVDPPEAASGPGDSPLESVEVGHVGLEHHGPVAELRGERLEPVGLEADQRHIRALGVQPARRLGADAARGAGDERRATGDVVLPGHDPLLRRLPALPGRRPG